jgi:hypothetical protein
MKQKTGFRINMAIKQRKNKKTIDSKPFMVKGFAEIFVQ